MNCHLGRFRIADFTDEDHVRCLPQHRPDDTGEVQADVMFHLDLVDPRQVILHRILGRDDLLVGPIQFAQGTVESRRLSAPRRTGDQKNAIRAADDRLEFPVVFISKAEVADADFDVVAVQNSEHDRLAKLGGKNTDSQVEVFSAGSCLDAAVLGASLFGDVHPSHDL